MVETASSSSGATTARGSIRMCGLLDWRVVVREHISYSRLEVVNVIGADGCEARLSGEACMSCFSVSRQLDGNMEKVYGW